MSVKRVNKWMDEGSQTLSPCWDRREGINQCVPLHIWHTLSLLLWGSHRHLGVSDLWWGRMKRKRQTGHKKVCVLFVICLLFLRSPPQLPPTYTRIHLAQHLGQHPQTMTHWTTKKEGKGEGFHCFSTPGDVVPSNKKGLCHRNSKTLKAPQSGTLTSQLFVCNDAGNTGKICCSQVLLTKWILTLE